MQRFFSIFLRLPRLKDQAKVHLNAGFCVCILNVYITANYSWMQRRFLHVIIRERVKKYHRDKRTHAMYTHAHHNLKIY